MAPEEREQLAEFNLIAGKLAQASCAYASALTYLTTGAALLSGDSGQDRRGSQSNGGNQLADFSLAFVYQVGASFRMLAAEEGVTYRENTAPHAIACVDDGDTRAFRPELARGRQAGKPGTGHENGNAAHAKRDQSAKYRPTEERSLIG